MSSMHSMTVLTDREAIKAYLLHGLNTNLVYGRMSDTQSFLGYFKIPSLTVFSTSYLVSIEITFLFVECTTQRSKV